MHKGRGEELQGEAPEEAELPDWQEYTRAGGARAEGAPLTALRHPSTPPQRPAVLISNFKSFVRG